MRDLPTLSEEKHLLQNPNFQFQVARLGQLAIQIDNLTEFMQVVVETVSKTLGTELCKILQIIPDEEKLLLISGVGWKEGIVGNTTVRSKENSQAGFTLLTNEPVIVKDLTNETRFKGPNLLTDHKVRSGLSVVIRGRDGIFGVIGAHSTEILPLGEDHANFLQSVSFILASALDNQQRIQEIQRREARYRELIEEASDAIFISDLNDSFVQVNSKATELTGYSREELLSMRIQDLLYDQDQIDNMISLETMKIGHSNVVERNMKQKSNSVIPVEVNVKKIDGNTIQAIVRDLTHRKILEEQMIKESKYDAFSHLSGGIAHDFNNLLNVIMGNISIAQSMEIDNTELGEILSHIQVATERASNITKQLLTFSRKYKPDIEIVDIRKLLNEVVDFTFHGSKIEPSIIAKDVPHLIEADIGQITQVIQNVLINADQAIEDQAGKIEVLLQEGVDLLDEDGDLSYYLIKVKDNGIGISENTLDKVFDPFFTTKDTGKGLGLATTYTIVQNHGGRIEIQSELGKGTSIEIYLPRYTGESGVTREQSSQNNDVPTLQGTLLVLEDEEMIQNTIVRMSSILGLEVIITSDGNDTVTQYETITKQGRTVDYVILDLTIPGGLGGHETLKKLQLINPEVNAIVCTGYSEDFHIENYRDYGFTEKLSKPYTLDNLYETLIRSKEV